MNITEIEDVNNLGESDLYRCTVEDAYAIIRILNQLNWSDIDSQQLIDNFGFYVNILDIFDYRISQNTFESLSDNQTEKEHFSLMILRLRMDISQYRIKYLVNDMKVEANAEIHNTLKKSQDDFDKRLSKQIEQATNNIQPKLISTVLTVMGVFSAIITTIISVVTTTSSWLNNADGASAIIAFIIPNLIVVFSVAILLGIVFDRKSLNM